MLPLHTILHLLTSWILHTDNYLTFRCGGVWKVSATHPLNMWRGGSERQISSMVGADGGKCARPGASCEPCHSDGWGDVELKVSSWMPDGITTKKGTQATEETYGFSLLTSLSITLQVCHWWMGGEQTVAILAARKPEPGLVFVPTAMCNEAASTPTP